jgi:hypothetical protein
MLAKKILSSLTKANRFMSHCTAESTGKNMSIGIHHDYQLLALRAPSLQLPNEIGLKKITR